MIVVTCIEVVVEKRRSEGCRRYRIVPSDEAIETAGEVRLTVPELSLFVMGDNRDRSRVNREFRSVCVSALIGDVGYVFPRVSW